MTTHSPRIFVLALAALAVAAGAGLAQDFGGGRPEERYFRVEFSPATSRSGRPVLQGYLYNRHGEWAYRVRLLVEGLDAAGAVTATSIGYVTGDVPAGGRSYFEIAAPAPAARWRVRVFAYEWLPRGSG